VPGIKARSGMLAIGMKSKAAHRVAVLFSVWMIVVQAVIGVPLAQRVMAPVELLPGGGFALCTAAGRIDVGGGEHHVPADQAPSCPFCMPICGGAATVAVAPPVPMPVRMEPVVHRPVRLAGASLPAPWRFLQPRAPPTQA
jgi:Protein of unknown function (DUF2946)